MIKTVLSKNSFIKEYRLSRLKDPNRKKIPKKSKTRQYN